MIKVHNLEDDFKNIHGRPWIPLDIDVLNNHKIRLGYFRGDYGWHKHEKSDQFFLVIRGKITIQVKDHEHKVHALMLCKNDHIMLPKGTPHNLLSAADSYVMVVEPIHMDTTVVKH